METKRMKSLGLTEMDLFKFKCISLLLQAPSSMVSSLHHMFAEERRRLEVLVEEQRRLDAEVVELDKLLDEVEDKEEWEKYDRLIREDIKKADECRTAINEIIGIED